MDTIPKISLETMIVFEGVLKDGSGMVTLEVKNNDITNYVSKSLPKRLIGEFVSNLIYASLNTLDNLLKTTVVPGAGVPAISVPFTWKFDNNKNMLILSPGDVGTNPTMVYMLLRGVYDLVNTVEKQFGDYIIAFHGEPLTNVQSYKIYMDLHHTSTDTSLSKAIIFANKYRGKTSDQLKAEQDAAEAERKRQEERKKQADEIQAYINSIISPITKSGTFIVQSTVYPYLATSIPLLKYVDGKFINYHEVSKKLIEDTKNPLPILEDTKNPLPDAEAANVDKNNKLQPLLTNISNWVKEVKEYISLHAIINNFYTTFVTSDTTWYNKDFNAITKTILGVFLQQLAENATSAFNLTKEPNKNTYVCNPSDVVYNKCIAINTQITMYEKIWEAIERKAVAKADAATAALAALGAAKKVAAAKAAAEEAAATTLSSITESLQNPNKLSPPNSYGAFINSHIDFIDSLMNVRTVVNFRTGFPTAAEVTQAETNLVQLLDRKDGEANLTASVFAQTQKSTEEDKDKRKLRSLVHKGLKYGPFYRVINGGTALDVDDDVKKVIKNHEEKNQKPLHFVYSAYGFSGSGKSFALLTNPSNDSVFNRVIKIIQDNPKYDVRLLIYDLYGEIADEGCERISPALPVADLKKRPLSAQDVTFFKYKDNNPSGEKFVFTQTSDEIALGTHNGDVETLRSHFFQKKSHMINLNDINIPPKTTLLEKSIHIIDELMQVRDKSDYNVVKNSPQKYHVRMTPNNPVSSRAHLFIDVYIVLKDDPSTVVGKVTIMDMAGSENVDVIQKDYFVIEQSKDIHVNTNVIKNLSFASMFDTTIPDLNREFEKANIGNDAKIRENNDKLVRKLSERLQPSLFAFSVTPSFYTDVKSDTWLNLYNSFKKPNDHLYIVQLLLLHNVASFHRQVFKILKTTTNLRDLIQQYAVQNQSIKWYNKIITEEKTFANSKKEDYDAWRDQLSKGNLFIQKALFSEEDITFFVDDLYKTSVPAKERVFQSQAKQVLRVVAETKILPSFINLLCGVYSERRGFEASLRKYKNSAQNIYNSLPIDVQQNETVKEWYKSIETFKDSYIVSELASSDNIHEKQLIEQMQATIRMYHCPLRFQGNFINVSLLDLVDYAKQLSTKSDYTGNNILTAVLMRNNIFNPNASYNMQQKFVLMSNIRLDFILNEDKSKNQVNDARHANYLEALETSLQFAHCINPFRIRGDNAANCLAYESPSVVEPSLVSTATTLPQVQSQVPIPHYPLSARPKLLQPHPPNLPRPSNLRKPAKATRGGTLASPALEQVHMQAISLVIVLAIAMYIMESFTRRRPDTDHPAVLTVFISSYIVLSAIWASLRIVPMTYYLLHIFTFVLSTLAIFPMWKRYFPEKAAAHDYSNLCAGAWIISLLVFLI